MRIRRENGKTIRVPQLGLRRSLLFIRNACDIYFLVQNGSSKTNFLQTETFLLKEIPGSRLGKK